MNFYLSLKDKLRQSEASYNSNKLKLYYQVAVRMTKIEPRDFTDHRYYAEEGEPKDALAMSLVTEFWSSVMNTFGALYEAVFKSVYSTTAKYFTVTEQ